MTKFICRVSEHERDDYDEPTSYVIAMHKTPKKQLIPVLEWIAKNDLPFYEDDEPLFEYNGDGEIIGVDMHNSNDFIMLGDMTDELNVEFALRFGDHIHKDPQ